MTYYSIAISAASYRRFRTAQRVMTLAPVVPSQDATRYQARDMPPPTYALAQKNASVSRLTILLQRFTTLFHS